MADEQRHQYIRAVQCMMTLPGTATSTLSIVRNRFEDFLATHVKQTDFVHFVVSIGPYSNHCYEKDPLTLHAKGNLLSLSPTAPGRV